MREFGLIGKSLSHSFSKEFFDNKFNQEFINDAKYHLFTIDSIEKVKSLILNNQNLVGINVTIPYKSEVLPYISHLDKAAKEIGAVNCIKIKRTIQSIVTYGYNTDAFGFRKSIESLLMPWHTSALVLGNGGAAKAVIFVLKSLNIETQMVSRNRKSNTIDYKDLTKEIIQHNLLIINTTPLGMFPNIADFPPIPYPYITEKHLLYDLIYNPYETEFLAKGKACGAVVKNGQEMLELQALKSWEIWNEY